MLGFNIHARGCIGKRDCLLFSAFVVAAVTLSCELVLLLLPVMVLAVALFVFLTSTWFVYKDDVRPVGTGAGFCAARFRESRPRAEQAPALRESRRARVGL